MPSTPALTNEQKLATLRSLPERGDNLTPQQENWLDNSQLGVPDGSVEGHEDISMWQLTEGGSFLLDVLDSLSDAHQEEGGGRPTGTIFELDLFRERLERRAGSVEGSTTLTDGGEVDTGDRLARELRHVAAELKTLIDNCMKQYVRPTTPTDHREPEGDGCVRLTGVVDEVVPDEHSLTQFDPFKTLGFNESVLDALTDFPAGKVEILIRRQPEQHTKGTGEGQ